MKVVKLIISAALYLLLCSCQSSDQATEKASDRNKNKQRVSITVPPAPPNWLTLIAIEKGYLEDEGLEVSDVYYPSGKRAFNALLQGKVDIAASADIPIVKASFRRQDFSIFATVGTSTNDNKIVARKSHGIHTPKDLQNKTISTQQNASAHFFMHLFLLNNGIAPDNIKAHYAKIELLPELIKANKVDAISTREPFTTQTINHLADDAIVFSEKGLFLKNFNLIANKSYIQNNPSVIKKILRGLIRAENFLLNHQQQASLLLAEKLNIPETTIKANLHNLILEVTLDQALLRILSDEARWYTKNDPKNNANINYLDLIYLDALKAVRPESVTIIH